MIRIVKNIILVLLGIISLSVRAEVYVAKSVEEISNSLISMLDKRNTENTLVLLSLENLIEPTAPAFHTMNSARDEEYQILAAQISKRVKSSQIKYIGEVTLTEYEQRLSDPYIVEFIKKLQVKNTPFLVTTKNFSGNFNKIPYLEVWTWKYLFDKGIDLSKSPVGSKQMMFDRLHKKIDGTYPTLYKGLLSCNSKNGENSPQSLIAYLLLEELKWMPDVIYVVDKDEKYIKSVEQQFKSLRPNSQVIGFVYSPPHRGSTQMDKKQFVKFWENLSSKLNAVKRKTPGNKDKKLQ